MASSKKNTKKSSKNGTKRKTPAKKTSAKKTPAKKTSAKKTLVKKVSPKKTPVKKTLAKKVSPKKTSAKKTLAKKVSPKKTPVKKTLAKKVSSKKTSAKKTPTKKTSAKKISLKKAAYQKPSIKQKKALKPEKEFIPLDPVTKEPIDRPKTWQKIIWGVKNLKSGKIWIPDQRGVTRFFKTDYKELQKQAAKSKKGHLIFYAYKTNIIARDDDGNVIKDDRGKVMRLLRYTGDVDKKLWARHYYKNKRMADKDIGYKKKSERTRFDIKKDMYVKPGDGKVYHLKLTNSTIKESIYPFTLMVAKGLINSDRKIAISWYLTVRDIETGALFAASPPFQGKTYSYDNFYAEESIEMHAPDRDTYNLYAHIADTMGIKDPSFYETSVSFVANLHSKLARDIRTSLLSHGLNYTRPRDLYKFYKETMKQKIDEYKKRVKDFKISPKRKKEILNEWVKSTEKDLKKRFFGGDIFNVNDLVQFFEGGKRAFDIDLYFTAHFV